MNISKSLSYTDRGKQTVLRAARKLRSLFDHLADASGARNLTSITFDRAPTDLFLRRGSAVLVFVGLVGPALTRHVSLDMFTLRTLRRDGNDDTGVLKVIPVLVL
jgi:hypothetical protein